MEDKENEYDYEEDQNDKDFVEKGDALEGDYNPDDPMDESEFGEDESDKFESSDKLDSPSDSESKSASEEPNKKPREIYNDELINQVYRELSQEIIHQNINEVCAEALKEIEEEMKNIYISNEEKQQTVATTKKMKRQETTMTTNQKTKYVQR